MSELLQDQDSWIQPLLILAGVLLAIIVAHALFFFIVRRVARRTGSLAADAAIAHGRLPSLVLLLLLAVHIALPLFPLPASLVDVSRQILSILLIVTVAWVVIKLTNVGRDLIAHHYDITAPDNLAARKINTQYRILQKVIVTIVVILSLAAILMTFDKVKQLGAGILASAGIVGLIVGLAAQRTLGTLIAGIQIALTQPIRLDDVVIVEGEWGRVEEINLTFAVVRIWDLRRLVVPITYFLEKPFQNWTRVSADLLGAVFLSVDYAVPVDALRAELKRLVEGHPKWDGKVCGLQVTNSSERTLELRALVSAANSGDAWDLRCEVREKLVTFIQQNYPDALPRLRAEIHGEAPQV
jgi:small-conductance mechanosensitive channel